MTKPKPKFQVPPPEGSKEIPNTNGRYYVTLDGHVYDYMWSRYIAEFKTKSLTMCELNRKRYVISSLVYKLNNNM